MLIDRGFLSGKWIGDLKSNGVDTVIGLKTDMTLYEDMISLAGLPETVWLEADLPKYNNSSTTPTSRHIAYLSDLETWDSCKVPLAGIVILDTYPDKVLYQCVVTTDLEAEPEEIHCFIRNRWSIEETFMRESRYGSLNKVGPCRPAVAAAIAHFSLLTVTLVHLFAEKEQLDVSTVRFSLPIATVELVAYWNDYYTIILMSKLMAIMVNWPPGVQQKAQQRQKAFEEALLRQ